MYDFIEKMLTELPLDIQGTAKTPAAKDLFTVSDNAKKLPEEKAQLFHHLVAKLLYLCKRTTHEIQNAMVFLCTRVKQSDKHEYKKFTCVLQCIRGSQELTFTR